MRPWMKHLAAATILVVGMSTTSTPAQSQAAKKTTPPRPKAAVVRGEVLDLSCWLARNLSGPLHQDCARKCLASGVPMGIITTPDSTLWLLTQDHGRTIDEARGSVRRVIENVESACSAAYQLVKENEHLDQLATGIATGSTKPVPVAAGRVLRIRYWPLPCGLWQLVHSISTAGPAPEPAAPLPHKTPLLVSPFSVSARCDEVTSVAAPTRTVARNEASVAVRRYV